MASLWLHGLTRRGLASFIVAEIHGPPIGPVIVVQLEGIRTVRVPFVLVRVASSQASSGPCNDTSNTLSRSPP